MMISDNLRFVEFNPSESTEEMFEHFFDLDDEWEMEEDPDEPLSLNG